MRRGDSVKHGLLLEYNIVIRNFIWSKETGALLFIGQARVAQSRERAENMRSTFSAPVRENGEVCAPIVRDSTRTHL